MRRGNRRQPGQYVLPVRDVDPFASDDLGR
jgi:hypothetical protein